MERLTDAGAGRGGAGLLPAGRPQERPRPHRPGQGEDRRVHRLLCDQSGQRRADADLGGRLRADQLRHGRDHGRAGPRHPRLRVCRAVRPADSRRGRSGRRCRRAARRVAGRPGGVHRRRHGGQLRPLRRPAHGRVQDTHRRRPAIPGPGPPGGKLQAPRLALQPPALLGRALSHPARTRRRGPAQRPHPRLAARGLAGRSARSTWPSTPAHDRPEPPLEKAPDDWLYVTLDGKRYKRETNTMPQWAGSCWYYLRFLDPHNDRAWSIRQWKRRGCRSISTWAGRNMPCCTCSTPASGTRCSSTAAT